MTRWISRAFTPHRPAVAMAADAPDMVRYFAAGRHRAGLVLAVLGAAVLVVLLRLDRWLTRVG